MQVEYQPLYDILVEYKADEWVAILPGQIERIFSAVRHGDLQKWMDVVQNQPLIEPSVRVIDMGTVTIGCVEDFGQDNQEQLKSSLQKLHPWRKGPYELFGIKIDTEWRSDWKWKRLAEYITPLQNRLVLDVGCGNGYHCWRMLGAGAKMVIGIDPTLLSNLQFQAIRKLYGEAPVYVLPIGIEDVPYGLRIFDTVFSMGVFYHRRSPIDHLLELRDCLRAGGELVLETLVIDARHGDVLLPQGRYAKMRNVWFIPGFETLISWMRRCGFINIRLVDMTKTTVEEQRSTEWMRFHSLQDFLDPDDPDLTVEGLPAPVRAIIIANVN
jgi:tRNA (mo5U34)-methyltransferase